MSRLLASLALAVLLAGCAASGSGQAHRYFVLEPTPPAPPATPSPTPPRRQAVLLVAPVVAAGFYDTREIAYSRSAGTRAYYQLSSWAEPPASAIATALLGRLDASGAFRGVVASGAGVRGSLLLRVHLDELYHDAAVPPGSARLAVSAELADIPRRVLLGRRSFAATVPAATHDADGAVGAMRQALDAVLAELSAWTISTAEAAERSEPPR
jgi:cholesterol transport system auxiliary component